MDLSFGRFSKMILRQRAWASSGEELDDALRWCFNSALLDMLTLAPEGVAPRTISAVFLADQKGDEVGARLKATPDPWVLEIVMPSGASWTPARAWQPVLTGEWNGVMHLDIERSDGTLHRRQCRDWWYVSEGKHTTRYYVSIDRPWRNTTDTNLSFRVYQPYVWLPSDVVDLVMPVKTYDEDKRILAPINKLSAELYNNYDFRGRTQGPPQAISSGPKFELPAPQQPPLIEWLPAQGFAPSWIGPMPPPKKARVCYTFAWGKRPQEWQDGPGGIRDPIWESPPSPVAEVPQLLGGKSGTAALRFTGVNIDAVRGFDVSGTIREAHSGLYLRWYIALESFDALGGSSAYRRWDFSTRFHLLGETRAAQVTPEGSFEWRGVEIPDHERPLVHATGYQAYSIYPHQDKEITADFDVIQLPKEILTSSDTVPINPLMIGAFQKKLLEYAALVDGNDVRDAQVHRNAFQEDLGPGKARVASPIGVVEVTPFGGQRDAFPQLRRGITLS